MRSLIFPLIALVTLSRSENKDIDKDEKLILQAFGESMDDLDIDEAIAQLDKYVPAMSAEVVRSIVRRESPEGMDLMEMIPMPNQIALISAAMAFAVGDTVPTVTRVLDEVAPAPVKRDETLNWMNWLNIANNPLVTQFMQPQSWLEEWQRIFQAPRRNLKYADEIDIEQKRELFNWFAREVNKVKGQADELESMVVRLFDDILDKGINLPQEVIEGASWQRSDETQPRRLAEDMETMFVNNIRVAASGLRQMMQNEARFLNDIPSEYIAASRTFLKSLPQEAQVALMDDLLKMAPNSNDGDYLNYISRHQTKDVDQAPTLFLFRFSRALSANAQSAAKANRAMRPPMPKSSQSESDVIQPTQEPPVLHAENRHENDDGQQREDSQPKDGRAPSSPETPKDASGEHTSRYSPTTSHSPSDPKSARPRSATRSDLDQHPVTAVNSIIATPAVEAAKYLRGFWTRQNGQRAQSELPMLLTPFLQPQLPPIRVMASSTPESRQIEEDIKHTLKLPLQFLNDLSKMG